MYIFVWFLLSFNLTNHFVNEKNVNIYFIMWFEMTNKILNDMILDIPKKSHLKHFKYSIMQETKSNLITSFAKKI